MSEFFLNLFKSGGLDTLVRVSDNTDESVHFVDTGSYALNALLSGSIYKGLPDNKVTAFAGEPSTGKSFICLSIAANFQRDNPESGVVLFETEGAIDKTIETRQMLGRRGIDTSRFFLESVETIQEFRTKALNIVNTYLETKEEDRKPLLLILDSLGGLSTIKEMEDSASGSDTRDMTLAQKVKGTFRTLTLKLNKARIPLVITSHVYDQMGSMFPTKVMGGGRGTQYAASIIAFLSKAKAKDSSGDVTGAYITFKLIKSRLTKEQKEVTLFLNHAKGLDKYVGLLDIAETAGLIKKTGNKFELPNGDKAFESVIYKNPTKYFTKDFLDAINDAAQEMFLYGDEGELEVDVKDVGETDEELD